MFEPATHACEDYHVHSTMSDGRGTLAQNVAAAQSFGVETLGCVEHVRAGSRWLPSYVHQVRDLRASFEGDLLCGIEAKMLNQSGLIDMPADICGVDRIIVADHQWPGTTGPILPRVVMEGLASRTVTPRVVLSGLVLATVAALRRHHGATLAHLFSLLPKVGLVEGDVSGDVLGPLVEAAVETGATLELSERWKCPGERVARSFMDAGVPIVASTDAHDPKEIGRYRYVTSLMSDLGLSGDR